MMMLDDFDERANLYRCIQCGGAVKVGHLFCAECFSAWRAEQMKGVRIPSMHEQRRGTRLRRPRWAPDYLDAWAWAIASVAVSLIAYALGLAGRAQ